MSPANTNWGNHMSEGDRFNHQMLTLAREARELTQAELAKRAAIGQGTLSKYETGILEVPQASISDLASVLDFPVSFFFQPGRPHGLPPFHYRKRKKLSAKCLSTKFLIRKNRL